MASLSQLPLLGCFHPTAETMFLHSSPAYDLLYHFSLNPLCRYPLRVYDYLNVKPLIDPTFDALFLYRLPERICNRNNITISAHA